MNDVASMAKICIHFCVTQGDAYITKKTACTGFKIAKKTCERKLERNFEAPRRSLAGR